MQWARPSLWEGAKLLNKKSKRFWMPLLGWLTHWNGLSFTMKMTNAVSNCKCIIWKMSFGCGLFRAKLKASILAAFMKWAKRLLWQSSKF